MAIETIAKCDLCGAVRQACNHWFLGRHGGGRQSLVILSYSLSEAHEGGDILCGEGCLHKWLTQNLGELGQAGEPAEESVK